MISEGSCDTEDWSNDAENTALITAINNILLYIQMENNYFKILNYFTILLFLRHFRLKKIQPWWAEETQNSKNKQILIVNK